MIAFLNLIDNKVDKNKFTELYEKYKDLVYWIAYQKVHNVQDAEECVQETFFYVAKNFDKIGDVDSKMTKCYLSTIVTGFAIDIYNKSLKMDSVSNDTEITYSYDEFDIIDLLSVFDDVLDEESRIIFYLKYLYGYKSREIAEIYNVNDTYIRKKLQISKEKLRSALKEKYKN